MKGWNILPVIPFTVLSVAGQISIGENLAFEGAGSFAFVSEDSSASGEASAIEIQEIIIELDFNFEKLAAEVEIELGDGDMELDAVFVDYAFNELITLRAGRFHSLLFYEADHLFRRLTRTRAQSMLPEVVPGANQGVQGLADTERGGLAVSWIDQLWDQPTGRSGLLNGGDGAVEAQMGFRPLEGLEVVLVFGGQDSGDTGPNGQIFDVWASFEQEKYLLVAEYADFDNAGAQDADENGFLANSEYLSGKTWMVLGSYHHTEKTSFTLRYSMEDLDGGAESTKWTLAPSHMLSEHLTARLEYSRERQEQSGLADKEIDLFSVEGLFRF